MQTTFSHGPRATFGRVRGLARLRLPSFSTRRASHHPHAVGR